ncbi:hypothetical protein QR685DRAFT_309256 [Neurospora intermedia]|uniref:Secreted protein n=1 Tax=Neurospora intermedia TaxID=5142 RepID=A0ABR3D8M0_NEUIN
MFRTGSKKQLEHHYIILSLWCFLSSLPLPLSSTIHTARHKIARHNLVKEPPRCSPLFNFFPNKTLGHTPTGR